MSRTLLTLSIILLVAASLASTGCSPWYAKYGIDDQSQLHDPASYPNLVQAVRTGSEYDAYRAARILASADAETLTPIVGPLFTALARDCDYVDQGEGWENSSTYGCEPIVQIARTVGPARAVPELARLNPFAASITLGALGPEGRGGVRAVIAALGSPYPAVRVEAANALRNISYPGPEVIAALESVLGQDTDDAVQDSASRALRTLEAIALSDPDQALPLDAPTTTGPSTTPATRPNDIAIIIGIEQYRGDVPPSTGARTDATYFANLAEERLGLARRNIILLTDDSATKSSLETYLLDWLPKNVKDDGRVFFFFAGHGAPDPQTGKGYLVPWDADPRFITRQGIEFDDVANQLQALEVAEVYMMVDACFSGSGGRSVLPPGTRPLVPIQELDVQAAAEKSFALLAAAGANEITGTTADGKHGLFSHYLFEALAGGADQNGDGIVTVQEIADYLGEHVPNEAARDNRSQTPRYHFSSDAVGELELVRAP